MVVLAHAAKRRKDAGLPGRNLPGEHSCGCRVDAGDWLDCFRRVLLQPFAHKGEDGGHGRGAGACRHLPLALERWNHRPPLEGPSRGGCQALAAGVPNVELLVASALGEVACPEVAVRRLVHEQGQVCLFADEGLVDELFLHDDLGHGERQRGICADLHGDEVVRV